jgi:drug/metabolite transporter (DMT)-like permease
MPGWTQAVSNSFLCILPVTQSVGILFALLTMLSWSICIFPFTQAARRLGSNTLNHFRLLLAIFFLATANLIADHKFFLGIFSSSYSYSWMWLGFSGIVGLTIGDYFAFKMYAILSPRIGSVLTTLSPAAALVSGYILLGETINLVGIAGMVITMIGVISISLGRRERDAIPDRGHGSIITGIIFGILSAVCQGVGLVLSKKGMMHDGIMVDPLPATFMRITVGFFSLLLFTILQGKLGSVIAPVVRNQNGGIKYAVMGTIFGPFLGVCLSLYTISNLDVSVGQTIFSLMPVCALLISVWLLKEKVTYQSLLGVVVAIGGVVILIWRMKLHSLFFN